MSKAMIVGASGQLGQELQRYLKELDWSFDALTEKDLDITDKTAVAAKIAELKPEVILDAAAYTAVDKAEDEGKELNWHVNVDGTKILADAAADAKVKLIYISTDYVFDGTNEGMYLEDDPANPKNEYGRAKWAGEEAVRHSGADYYIVRTSWVFGEFGHNFVFTMQNLAKTHDKLTVVNDQTGRPTWTRTLAEFMIHLLQVAAPFGTYQLSNDDSCNWYEFAKEILKDTDVDVQPVTSEQFPQKAYRPRHSVMDLSKAKSTGFEIPTWKEALQAFLASLVK
ncbi:dTDP-4-dehydrorhamnose reductase [Lactiplantibacillus fabifermentans]|uniref:dTDP-4-dehydrorhamnose reductase n=2 Tax=Lactiplantibacillus fabifermentans TaxID=483011 RepID=A0A0R2NPM0_9LACO|nr:dTDP-4-dehydrorhamnose reductase [Lactiplantibacillus fabifermentans]ETY74876.1 dTDP-4-dehydrorhamnose reductase [Lactiplantibacillus fabifermentans T30PCM01]KRO27620.1 dTDP-4-dehydrorhamnose reductase [Lactiplantibacillus fabifermentans DSM 21115]